MWFHIHKYKFNWNNVRTSTRNMSSRILDLKGPRVRIGVTSDPTNAAMWLHFTKEYEASDHVIAIPHRSTEERPRIPGFTSTHPIVHQVSLHDDDLEVLGVDHLISSQISSVNREDNVVEVLNRRVVEVEMIVLYYCTSWSCSQATHA